MQTQSDSSVTLLERDHPLVTFILDSYNGSCIEDEWLQRTLNPALISLGTLRFGEKFKFNGLKLSDIPNQSGDELLTLELVPDEDPSPDLITLYAFESNLKTKEGKGMSFYIVAAKLGYDAGVTPKVRNLLEACLDSKFKLPYSGEVVELKAPTDEDIAQFEKGGETVSSPKLIDKNSAVVKLVVLHFGQMIGCSEKFEVTSDEVDGILETFKSGEYADGDIFMVSDLFVPTGEMKFEPLTIIVSKVEDQFSPDLYRIEVQCIRYPSGDPYYVMVNPNGSVEPLTSRRGSVKVISLADHGKEVWYALLKAQAEAKTLAGKDEWIAKLPNQLHLPQHITFNPATKSYYKYKATPNEDVVSIVPREPITFIDIEVNPNSSKILRGWTLEELEAIVKHLKEHENEHV